jgi:DNA-binding MarR family transcriptional regulator
MMQGPDPELHTPLVPAGAGRENTEVLLGVLSAVEANATVTQRHVADQLGVALGLVNTYLKRAITKGLVKVAQVPANRLAYYLTPQGFAEKSRLTAEYLAQGLSLFRQARAQYTELMAGCAERGWTRVVLAGTGDICDIALLCAPAAGVQVVGLFDPGCELPRYAELKVTGAVPALPAHDAVILATAADAPLLVEQLREFHPANRVLCPRFLGIKDLNTMVKEQA